MKFLLIYSILVFGSLPNCLSQIANKNPCNDFTSVPDTLYALKIKCECKTSNYSLIIKESKTTKDETQCNPFKYNFLYTADYNIKIQLIKDLFSYAYDSSVSCIPIKCYSPAAYKKHGNNFSKDKLSIQVMALYHINLICFGQFAVFMYSPYPILYDAIGNKIINNDQEKIKEVFTIYMNWLNNNLKNGFTNFTFPLFNSRYKWIYGNYSRKLRFTSLPRIRSDYKEKIGVPVQDTSTHQGANVSFAP
ncbi:MAG: hypothetical protein HZA79_16805 [Sphingobacteriales bacterium]|nr:hypothetical protein [Sphingobacteriales bacterium]